MICDIYSIDSSPDNNYMRLIFHIHLFKKILGGQVELALFSLVSRPLISIKILVTKLSFLRIGFDCLRLTTGYPCTSLSHLPNASESIFSTALPQRSVAQPQKSKSIVDIFAWIAAHKPQPISDMIMFSFMRAIMF